jgi:CheY-like chemotaxis protein
LGQAIAEHPEGKSQKLSPLALRDAARKLVDSQDHEAATMAIRQIREAVQGKASNEEPEKVAWKDLISMDDMMHVINTRNSQVVRAARRSRDPEGDSRHALTIAILSIAMAEQAEDYLSEEAEIAAWKKYARDFQTGMTDLAAALKSKDKAGIRKHLDFATKACNDCHAQFRDTE